MASDDLTLVLSGHLRRPQSADMRPFWRGFIELQKKLPACKPVRQIVAQSWNYDLAPLVRVVYAPQAERHDHQACFYPEFMWQIDPPDRFEQGLDRPSSTWKNVSIQSVLGNARARARAAELMDDLPSPGGQVLITRWDLGQTGSEQVNQLVADSSMPEDYLYLSYFAEIDEGYADMWILAPWADARRFGRFDAFVLDSLAGRNHYLEMFSRTGWPRARIKTRFETWRWHPIGQRAHALAEKIVQNAHDCAWGNAVIQRAMRRLTRLVQRFLSQPPVTAENSCVPGLEERLPVFPAPQALNIHALLKYFIMSEGLRDRARFLTGKDFDIGAQSGQLINPQPIVLLIHEADDAEVARLVSESPLPLGAIFLMRIDVVHQYTPNGDGLWQSTALYPTSGAPRDMMACAFAAMIRGPERGLPVLIMPTIARYLGCSDWFYMNALAKFLAWSQLGYVGLECSRVGKPHLDFPGLQMVRGRGAFSLHIAAGTADGIRAFVDTADPDLSAVCDRIDRMLLEFPVVKNGRSLF